MTTTFEYQNKFGKSISKEQFSVADDYIEIVKVDGNVKIEKSFVKEKLEHVTYYREINKIIQDINAQFPKDITINIRTLNHNYGNYKMIDEENYLNGQLSCVGQILKDNNDREIFFQGLDKTNRSPIPGTISKCYYFNDDEYYTFDYNIDGSIKEMDSTYHMNSGSWYHFELGDLNGFNWSEVGSYYQNACPIIPGTPV